MDVMISGSALNFDWNVSIQAYPTLEQAWFQCIPIWTEYIIVIWIVGSLVTLWSRSATIGFYKTHTTIVNFEQPTSLRYLQTCLQDRIFFLFRLRGRYKAKRWRTSVTNEFSLCLTFWMTLLNTTTSTCTTEYSEPRSTMWFDWFLLWVTRLNLFYKILF